MFFEYSYEEIESTKCAEFLYRKWIENKGDLNTLLCAGASLWYFFVERNDGPDFTSPSLDEYQKMSEITAYGFECFSDNYEFNMLFGYMIGLFPYYFEGDYNELEKKACEMNKKACDLAPDNPIPKIWHYGWCADSSSSYKQAKKEAEPYVKEIFSDERAEFERYFRNMLLP